MSTTRLVRRTFLTVICAILSAFRTYFDFLMFVETAELGPLSPPPLPDDYENDTLVIGNMTIHYRYSATFLDPPNATSPDFASDATPRVPSLVIGVISAPRNRHRRFAIRGTWGLGHNVHFLMGGNWADIEEEFFAHQDIIWMDTVESYKFGLTPKSMVLLHAARKMQTNYVFKTDDDMYVNFTKVESSLQKNQPHYWGNCNRGSRPFREVSHRWGVPEYWYPREFFPDYAMGMGYALDKNTVDCAVRNIEKAVYNGTLMPVEDVAVGLLAESCDAPCVQGAEKRKFKDQEGQLRKTGQELLTFHGISPQLLPLYYHNVEVNKVVNCGKPEPRSANRRHYAITCEQCVPAGWEKRQDLCKGDCRWSKQNNTCEAKPKKQKKVSTNKTALV